MPKPLTKVGRKVLINLAGAPILKFVRSPQGYFKILEPRDGTWDGFNKKSLYAALSRLYQNELISIVETLDGITEISILEKGKTVAEDNLVYEKITAPAKWDKRWRLIFFDIPENKKSAREAFRYHIKRLGFKEFHKSTFIFPYPCAREIEKLAERFEVKSNIRMAVAESVDGEFEYKKQFNLV